MGGTMVKIRTGFVSNSSSASFIISAAILKQPLLELILNVAGYGKFSRTSFINDLKREQTQEEKYIKEQDLSKGKCLDLRRGWVNNSKQRLKVISKLLKLVRSQKSSDIAVLEKQLEHNGLHIQENNSGMTRITGYTAMWNGMEDAGPLIPLIISILKLEKVPHDFFVESDN